MGFPFDVWHARANGNVYGGAETWSAGIWLGNPTANAPVPGQSDVDAIAARWKTLFTNGFMAISNAMQLNSVMLTRYGTDGLAIPVNTVSSTSGLPATGNNNGQAIPQVALALSFKTGVSKGQAANGRFYLPGPIHSLDGTGHILGTDMNNMVGVFKTFVDGINTDLAGVIGGPVRVVCASRGKPVKDPVTGHWTYPNPGVILNVTQLRIGNVFDTIDRRRNNLREVYSTAAVA